MKTWILAALAALIACGTAAIAALPGRIDWEAVEEHAGSGEIDFSLAWRTANSRSQHQRNIALADLAGLAPAQLRASRDTPVHFTLARDAGSFDCDGEARSGRGSGVCRFVPGAAFAAELVRRGYGGPADNDLLSLALAGIGHDYLAELDRQHFARPTVASLVAAGDHGVTLGYLRGIGELGYRVGALGALGALTTMRDHGVTPDYVRALTAHGVTDVSPADLVTLRDHGVSGEFVAAYRALGYRGLGIRDLIDLRDHGVGADYAREMVRTSGRNFPAATLIRMRDHGVSTGFVGELRSLGYGDLDADTVVRMRDIGMTGAAIRRANGEGGKRTPEELIRLRSEGRI